jgi:hypothetical protein
MSERVKNDFYPTPMELSSAIIQTLASFIQPPKWVIESSAGTGSFIQAARAQWPHVYITGVDVDPLMGDAMRTAGANQVVIGDWERIIQPQKDLEVLMVGNDPFNLQVAHILAGLRAQKVGQWHAKIGRMSLMGSRERVDFWKQHPCRLMFPLVPRPNFQKGMRDEETGKLKGGDNSEYMLYVWGKGFTGKAQIYEPIVWR